MKTINSIKSSSRDEYENFNFSINNKIPNTIIEEKIKKRKDEIKDLQDQVKLIHQYNKILSKIIG